MIGDIIVNERKYAIFESVGAGIAAQRHDAAAGSREGCFSAESVRSDCGRYTSTGCSAIYNIDNSTDESSITALVINNIGSTSLRSKVQNSSILRKLSLNSRLRQLIE